MFPEHGPNFPLICRIQACMKIKGTLSLELIGRVINNISCYQFLNLNLTYEVILSFTTDITRRYQIHDTVCTHINTPAN
jgi:hypothetical protein